MIAWPTHKARAATVRKKRAADKRRNHRLRRLVKTGKRAIPYAV